MKAKWGLGLVLVGLLALGFALACSSDDSTGSDPDPTDGDTQPDGDLPVDGDDGDIPDGDDPIDGDKPDGDGVIIEPTDGDDDGDRVDLCTSDRDCYGDQYCDPTTRMCRVRKNICEPCTSSLECGYREDLCLPGDGICGRWCQSVADCPTGFLCELVDGLTDKQCVFNAASTDGTMGSNCCHDNNCEEPLVCHPQTNKCYSGCTGNSACPPGQVCVDASDDNRNGHCKPGCDATMPCPAGTVCIEGVCVEGDCALKEHCPMEYICNTTSRRCVSGCEVDLDCYAHNECIGSTCVERVGCEGTFQCGVGQICTEEFEELGNIPPEDRGCCFNPKTTGTEECRNPFPDGPQKFCDACTDTNNENKECGDDDLCVELQQEDDNGNTVSLGHYCLIRWDCDAWTDSGLDEGTRVCPRGYTCVKIEEGQMAGKYCMANCTDPRFQ